MATNDQDNSTEKQNTSAMTAKNIIDKLVQQLEGANQKVQNLTSENLNLKSANKNICSEAASTEKELSTVTGKSRQLEGEISRLK